MILLLDASFLQGVAALIEGDQVVKEVTVPLGPLADEDLAVHLEAFLKEKITGFALGVGPGSYTGMRVAAALILPLAYARGLPLVTFCSLEGISRSKTVVVDGKRGWFYMLENGAVSLVHIDKLPSSFASPTPLNKIYPILEHNNIEQAPFKAANVLPTIQKKWAERSFESPQEVKLSYLQQVG